MISPVLATIAMEPVASYPLTAMKTSNRLDPITNPLYPEHSNDVGPCFIAEGYRGRSANAHGSLYRRPDSRWRPGGAAA